ncbi:MAG TPA: phosphoserine phosphatase SerB, partial [Kiloniellales bacterium]|nr:phosphoserine phosphatase SerB [Kiloniellales bacterium]
MTLIDDPQRAQLQVRHVEAVCSALRSSGATPVDVDWLAEGVACDLPFSWPEQGDTASLEQDLRQALGDVSLDLAVQPAAGRRKRLLVADLESTIIQQEMLDELGELIGKREKIATITERSMRGELNFEQALTERVALLAGLSEADLASVSKRMTLMAGAV